MKNLATRGLVGIGDNVLIGGLVITGTKDKTVIIRAGGPALVEAGVTEALSDPQMTLFSGPTVIDGNNDWRDHDRSSGIPDELKPSNDLEAAIYTELAPGAYTVIVEGAGNTTGVGIVEVFEVQ